MESDTWGIKTFEMLKRLINLRTKSQVLVLNVQESYGHLGHDYLCFSAVEPQFAGNKTPCGLQVQKQKVY